MQSQDKPESLCMAPWTHTYLSPQTERRMCCASREPAQNFEQYIDTAAGTGRYTPVTLEQHWNSDHMRSVRTRMMHDAWYFSIATLPDTAKAAITEYLDSVDTIYRDEFDRIRDFMNKGASTDGGILRMRVRDLDRKREQDLSVTEPEFAALIDYKYAS